MLIVGATKAQSTNRKWLASLLIGWLLIDHPLHLLGLTAFQVLHGRSLVKRYGIIFTCLAIRAVHVEVVHSLETDSFLMALKRFTARRGRVKEIRSDNGTNFTEGERELRKSINAITTKSMKLYYRRISSGCSTPHMGHIAEAFGSTVFALPARFFRHRFKCKSPTLKA